MTFAATAGVTYDIAVDGFATTSGPFTGNVSIAVSEVAAPTTTVTRPANDKFAGAKWLTGRSVTVTATQRERHPRDRRAEDQRQCRRQVRLVQLDRDRHRRDHDHPGRQQLQHAPGRLPRFIGQAQLTLVASNNDAATGIMTSKLSFRTTKGVTYRIAVDGYNGGSGAASGSIHLQLSGVITTAIRAEREHCSSSDVARAREREAVTARGGSANAWLTSADNPTCTGQPDAGINWRAQAASAACSGGWGRPW